MKRTKFVLFVVIGGLFGCKTVVESPIITTISDISINQIACDSIPVLIENSSAEGFTYITNNELYFLDKYFCRNYKIDTTGCVLMSNMGQGRAPHEIPLKEIIGVSAEGENLFVLDATRMLYHYKSFDNHKMISTYNPRHTTPRYDNPNVYTLDYEELNIVSTPQAVYLNIYSEHPELNYIMHTSEYCKHANVIMKISLEDGNCIMGGRYPQSYVADKKKIIQNSSISYDIYDDVCWINYALDSLIHKCNSDDLVCFERFGIAGVGSNITYKQLKYIPETNLLFRIYEQSQKDVICTRMQIYSDYTLIADVEVPNDFRIVGYIEPFYITQIHSDIELCNLWMYRFTL